VTSLARQVEARAAGRCEYCRMHQNLQGATFHMEHIVPSARGGPKELANLAWSCPTCNLRKSDHEEGLDPLSAQKIALFNPRHDQWQTHFQWIGYLVEGLTPTGRATVTLLDLNHSKRIFIRKAEELFGLFPP
jgi:hypothetical protein